MVKIKDRENLESYKRKPIYHVPGASIRLTADFLAAEMIKTEDSEMTPSKCWKTQTINQELYT